MGRNTIQNALRVCFRGFLFNIFLSHLCLKMSETRFAQSAITCSKLTIETLEQNVKYVQS